MSASDSTALGEWRSHFMLPLTAALGYATSSIHIYGLSPFYTPLEQAFGWSRAEVTLGLTIATLINGLFAIPVGMTVDRLGPRRVGILGVVLSTAAFAFMSTATGTSANWWLLWVLMAIATLPVQATIWTSAVAGRFVVSRGLALAVTLSGAAVSVTVFPLLATWLIEHHGWRRAFIGQGVLWAVITLPMLLWFFRGATDTGRKVAVGKSVAAYTLTGATMSRAMRSTIFHRLFIACLFFTFTIVALVVHFIPILVEQGTPRMAAAGTAALIGIFSAIGRLGTGVLIDRFRASRVGAVAFLLPSIACTLLMTSGSEAWVQVVVAAVIGLTLGSEVDVMAYLTARYFGLKNFGAIYGGLLLALSLGTAFGPLAAAEVFDRFGSYDVYLGLTVGCMAIASLSLLSLPPPQPDAGNSAP